MIEIAVALILIAIAAFLGIRHGRRAERARLERDYVKTRERMTDAETHVDSMDDAAVVDRLREHAGDRGMRRH